MPVSSGEPPAPAAGQVATGCRTRRGRRTLVGSYAQKHQQGAPWPHTWWKAPSARLAPPPRPLPPRTKRLSLRGCKMWPLQASGTGCLHRGELGPEPKLEAAAAMSRDRPSQLSSGHPLADPAPGPQLLLDAAHRTGGGGLFLTASP